MNFRNVEDISIWTMWSINVISSLHLFYGPHGPSFISFQKDTLSIGEGRYLQEVRVTDLTTYLKPGHDLLLEC